MSDLTGHSRPTSKQDLQPGAPYKKGGFIGQKYQVQGVLGEGGCGVVYLVYSHEVGGVFALKTFKDEYLADQEVRKRFQKEASVWVELGSHPYLVHAFFVDDISGRLYIGMEYVAPNEDGLNSLDGYLERRPPDLAQSLRWGIQICLGMEYAYSKGLRAHRDLKPANIMISQDGTARISDFGLAGVVSESPTMRAVGSGVSGLSGLTMLGTGFGTPAYMAPEQFDNAAACDERSDIYSFGIVLYQMAAGGQLPFLASKDEGFWQAMRQLHREFPVPLVDSPLLPIVRRCLEKSPENRYQTFRELRSDLEPMLQHQTGEEIVPPELKELGALEWSNKGASLGNLGRYAESIGCCEKALELDPGLADVWNNKGSSLSNLGRDEEAIGCYDKAIELAPCYIEAWLNKGFSLRTLGRYEDSIQCFDKALELDPRFAVAWDNKGSSLGNLGRYEEAIRCYDKAIELDPRCASAWYDQVICLRALDRDEEAIGCCEKALELDPGLADVWNNKGSSLGNLGRDEEAIGCYDKAIELDPRNAVVWYNKGASLHDLGRYEDAVYCFDKTLELDPRNAMALYNKGGDLCCLDRYEDAVHCFDKALELDLCHARAWFGKAVAEDSLSRGQEAAHSYQQFLALAPAQDEQLVEHARKRLRELGSK